MSSPPPRRIFDRFGKSIFFVRYAKSVHATLVYVRVFVHARPYRRVEIGIGSRGARHLSKTTPSTVEKSVKRWFRNRRSDRYTRARGDANGHRRATSAIVVAAVEREERRRARFVVVVRPKIGNNNDRNITRDGERAIVLTRGGCGSNGYEALSKNIVFPTGAFARFSRRAPAALPVSVRNFHVCVCVFVCGEGEAIWSRLRTTIPRRSSDQTVVE